MVVWIRSSGREYRTPNIRVAKLRFESDFILVNQWLAWLTPDFLTLSESTVNQVVSKRMVKHQQMSWTERGAHLLLQTRTRVLNGELEETFRRWYPQFRPEPRVELKAVA